MSNNKKVKKKKRNSEVIGEESDETVMWKQKRSGCESVEENKVVEIKSKQEDGNVIESGVI